MARRSLDQRLAEAEQVLAKRKKAQRQLLTRQKIIIGATVLSQVLTQKDQAGWLANLLRGRVTSAPDLTAIQPVLERLDALSPPGITVIDMMAEREAQQDSRSTASQPVASSESEPDVPLNHGLDDMADVSRRLASNIRSRW